MRALFRMAVPPVLSSTSLAGPTSNSSGNDAANQDATGPAGPGAGEDRPPGPPGLQVCGGLSGVFQFDVRHQEPPSGDVWSCWQGKPWTRRGTLLS